MWRNGMFMKKQMIVIVLLLGVTSVAEAADPCASLLCLSGKLTGQGGGSSCNQPIADYFSLIGFKNGGFSDGRTQGIRASYLNACNAPGTEQYKTLINNQYGRLRNSPF